MCVTCLIYTCVTLINRATPSRRLIYIYVVCVYLCDMSLYICVKRLLRDVSYIHMWFVFICVTYICV